MDRIPDLIATLYRLHDDLLAALAAEDHRRCQTLLGERDRGLASLAVCLDRLAPADRERWQPDLQALVRGDGELQSRFATARDAVGTRLAAGGAKPSAPRSGPPPGDRGGLDRRA